MTVRPFTAGVVDVRVVGAYRVNAAESVVADAATAGRPPSDSAPEWVFEFEWDGCLAVGSIDSDDSGKLFSRNVNDITVSYPDAVDALGVSAAGRQ